jgi:hypothetical protein
MHPVMTSITAAPANHKSEFPPLNPLNEDESPNFLTMLMQVSPVASDAGYPAVWGGKVEQAIRIELTTADLEGPCSTN